jgi:hypothetical protein
MVKYVCVKPKKISVREALGLGKDSGIEGRAINEPVFIKRMDVFEAIEFSIRHGWNRHYPLGGNRNYVDLVNYYLSRGGEMGSTGYEIKFDKMKPWFLII